MNKVEKGDKPLVYSVGGGKRLVAWKQENEETCVNFGKLIGFSSGIKFKLLVAVTPGALARSIREVFMGTNTVLAKDKKCGTCEYWEGKRTISRMIDNKPHSISVESGGYSCATQANKSVQGIGTCSKWKKWSGI